MGDALRDHSELVWAKARTKREWLCVASALIAVDVSTKQTKRFEIHVPGSDFLPLVTGNVVDVNLGVDGGRRQQRDQSRVGKFGEGHGRRLTYIKSPRE